jgi:hypothetical protein
MQLYLFPYLGCWQLIDALDCFVLLDDARYIQKGWVNRNRILKRGGSRRRVGKHGRSDGMLCGVVRHPAG